MKLRVSKTKFILLIVLFFVFLIGGGYLLINGKGLGLEIFGVDKYEELIDFCEIKKQEGKDLYVDCYTFLESESIDNDGVNCISFVTPYFDEEGIRLDTQVCEEENKIDWNNPYSNYSLHIPVVMTFRYKKSLFQFYKFQDLKIELMGDEKAFELWEIVDLFGPMYYKHFRTLGHKTTEELGYNITAEGDSNDEESFVPDGLVMYFAKIKSYQIEGDSILLEIEAFLNEQKTTFTLTTDGFYFFENVEDVLESVLIDSSNIEDIGIDVQYEVYFKFKEKGLVSEDFIEEQLALLIEGKESEFLFEGVALYEE
jgi:hypothetical protein